MSNHTMETKKNVKMYHALFDRTPVDFKDMNNNESKHSRLFVI